MSAVEVLAELRARGVKITARPGGKLGLRGPARVVAELRDEVRAHKAELLAFLRDSSRMGAVGREAKHSVPCLIRPLRGSRLPLKFILTSAPN